MKKAIYHSILAVLDNRIEEAQKAIDSAIESKLGETKSSVGDKYETGRAMMQKEQEMNEAKMAETVLLKKQLKQITYNSMTDKAKPGSLVFTDKGYFFIGIGLGKLVVNNCIVYAISAASPIGQKLLGLPKGADFEFNGETVSILELS